jgi:hypothetical protein
MDLEKTLATVLSCMVMSCLAAPVFAEEAKLHNTSFSYFSVGNEFIQYKENVPFAGKNLEMEVEYSNPIQRSGAYIPLFNKHGMYLVTSSTLSSSTAGEQWNFPGAGTIQTNDSKLSWNELNLNVARHLTQGHHLTFGFDYYTLKFTRFAFKSAAGTDTFNTNVGAGNTNANGTPNPFSTYAAWVAAGKNGDDFPGLRPESNLTTVVEDFSGLTTMFGYRYDSWFVDPDATWRFLGGVRVGLPLYFNVENSQLPGTTFTSYLSSGYDFGADAGVAWNINKRFALLGKVDYNHKHRNEIRNGASVIPENRVISVQSTIGLNWAF